jgi:hypothetical protein
MATPESKVKRKIKEILATKGKRLRQFWPVQSGLGEATLDGHICYLGYYLVIEAKAGGEVPTKRQEVTLGEYKEAGAHTLVLDGTDFIPLHNALAKIEGDYHNMFTRT